jgi:hypothetical protein
MKNKLSKVEQDRLNMYAETQIINDVNNSVISFNYNLNSEIERSN